MCGINSFSLDGDAVTADAEGTLGGVPVSYCSCPSLGGAASGGDRRGSAAPCVLTSVGVSPLSGRR